MPIYDYQCKQCGLTQELMCKRSAPSVEACPACAQETFARQVSAPSFQLSGTGWYATDFKDKKNNSPSKSDAKSAEKPTTENKACEPGCGCH